jgi:enterochelin esterase-like enzyme
MKKLWPLFAMIFHSVCASAADNGLSTAPIKVSAGKLYEYVNFPTRLITPRNVYIWVPEGYTEQKKYDVVYMHDGQMLFDSTATWNHQEWRVDETASELMQSARIRDCIIVGIWNIPEKRFYDYFPQQVLNFMPTDEYKAFDAELHAAQFDADNYLRFIVEDLKPYVDTHFSTLTDRTHTFLMGSSMGALISLYGLCTHPDVFGGAACLSLHSVMITSKVLNDRNTAIAAPAFCRYLRKNLPPANSAKIYIDYGSKTLDARYGPYQEKIDEVLYQNGWRKPFWTTNFYPGMAHTEKDWAQRLFVPFMFLLEK